MAILFSICGQIHLHLCIWEWLWKSSKVYVDTPTTIWFEIETLYSILMGELNHFTCKANKLHSWPNSNITRKKKKKKKWNYKYLAQNRIQHENRFMLGFFFFT